MQEVLSVDKAIVAILEGDEELATYVGGELKLYVDFAPENMAIDYWVIFELFSAPDSNAMGGDHVMSRPDYIIKVCNRDKGYQAIGPACKRINDLLTREHHGVYDGIHVGKFIRSQVMRGVDPVKDVNHYWIGQLFHLIAHGI